MNQNEVSEAFDILLEEIEAVIESLNQEVEKALRGRDYEKAKDLIEKGSQLKAFREKVNDLRQEWQNVFGGRIKKKVQTKRIKSRLKRGLRTPQDKFVIPILSALIRLGGSAPMKGVLDVVFEIMKSELTEYDMQPLPSNPSQPRWQNTAQWARLSMVKQGLLKSDSPRGIWEITEKGRRYIDSDEKNNP